MTNLKRTDDRSIVLILVKILLEASIKQTIFYVAVMGQFLLNCNRKREKKICSRNLFTITMMIKVN